MNNSTITFILFLGLLFFNPSFTGAQEITVADCTNSSDTSVDDEAKKATTTIAKAAAKQVVKKAVKQLVKSKKLAEGASEEAAESAGEEAAESAGEGAAEAVGEAVGEAAAELGAEVALEVATDPTPVALASIAVTAAIDAIWLDFKENCEGHPTPIFIDIVKAKGFSGYYLNLPDSDDILCIALPKAYDRPRLIINHGTSGWWKALVKFDKNNPTVWEEVVCITTGKTTSANYLDSDLSENYIVTISEAKDFGAHTNMYSIRNLENFGQDHDWYFIWPN